MIEDLVNGLVDLSATFVIPDWGELIALLPVFLLVPVIGYLAWLFIRFANAGPTRRGKRRLEPAPPAGVHMPGPSFAPFLAAVGGLFLVFGMVAGGIWLLVGVVILVITLLYWGREALRDYDQIPAASGEAVITGMLPAPAGTPPAGVHVPPPSFRPLLISIAATIFVAGMVVGGWFLFFGVVALVITLLGWLWDARKEYRAVEEADRTGHLDLGGAPAWPKKTFGALAVLVVFAVVLSSGILGGSDTGETGGAVPSSAPGGEAGGGAGAGGGGGAPASAAPSLPAADVTITATNIEFVEQSVTVPAGAPFTIAFDNQDPVPHDVVIKDGSGTAVFTGELVTGPTVVVYDVPAIPAGSYTFVCTVHPNMTGSITAQ